ncbi:thiol-activated cytolysin family protein [Cellulophaga sp. Hel_I_12]|uniref:thiol-activated cytolysin family protein n=1 Tax=Cellulophaga sp. Hel_I_12 TaxID=1249972 RepID=UPI00064677D7|nr:thiol-activated cytolysin family protein [Cellulophaga sp. Hel_I_12]
MKKIIQNALGLSLCLVTLTVSAQLRPPKTITVQKEKNVDMTKINKKPIPQLNVVKAKEYFKTLKVGTENDKEGARELTLVNNSFIETNKTTVKKGSVINNSKSICTKEAITVEIKALDFKAFSMNAKPDWLKPGIMMKAMSFIDGSNTIEEIKDRNPITLSSDLRVANPVFEVMNPSKKSQITTAENYLITQNGSPVPAQMSFYYHEVHSLEEMSFKLTGKYSSGMGMFSGSVGLNYGTEKEANYYMIEFAQNMFSIEVDGMDPTKVFVDPNVSTEDYIYLSKVNYGRKGVIVFKTNKSIEEFGLSLSAKVNGVIGSAEVKAAYNSLKSSSEVEMQAFYYGGSSAGAIQSIENSIKNGVPDIISYLKDRPFDHKLALPIGYELKNLKNERVGLDNTLKQIVRTCIPKQNFKLKVTLTDIQNINGRDGGGSNPDDYAIQQYVTYSANGKTKTFSSRNINTIPERANGPVQVAGMPNVLISGDADHQIHVREGNEPKNRNRFINNSLVFDITYDEFMDKNAQFKIYTWFKEYTNGKDKVLANNTPISVNIKEVLEILSGVKTLNESTPFFDTTIAKTVKFHNFGTGNLPLANIQTNLSKLVLEGPIRIGNPGEKAAVWLQFELVD